MIHNNSHSKSNMNIKIETAILSLGADTSACPIECLSDLIRKRAYQIYEELGRRAGHELDHWLQAELEIKHHLGI